MLKLAYTCSESANGYPIAYNGANEIAVEAFLQGKIHFTQIGQLTEKTLQQDWSSSQKTLEAILETDRFARKTALGFLGDLAK